MNLSPPAQIGPPLSAHGEERIPYYSYQVLATQSLNTVIIRRLKNIQFGIFSSTVTKRTKSQKIPCPCCGKARDAVEGTSLPQLEDKLLEANLRPWWNSKEGWSIEEASKGKLRWACRTCLKSGRAIEANPVVQKFCDYPPYLAYFDVPLRCEDCDSKFVFEAKEQQFWYEELKFWVQSRPKQCAACRKLRRERNRKQNEKV